MDLENLQMLQCIIYKSKKTSSNFMSQTVFFEKGLIKYSKLIGLLP